VVEVAFPPVQFGDLLAVNIEAENAEAGAVEGVGEGQTHVTETNDANTGLSSAEGGEEGEGRIGHGESPFLSSRVMGSKC
jgi:hypothetical protein